MARWFALVGWVFAGCASSLDLCGGGAVCGADGVTYADVCLATAADVPVLHAGVCEGGCDLPADCPELGCDGEVVFDASTCPATCACVPCPVDTEWNGERCEPTECDCDDDEVCDPVRGCVPFCETCLAGEMCNAEARTCFDCSMCRADEICRDDGCVPVTMACPEIACDDGEACLEGVCRPLCVPDVVCEGGLHCVPTADGIRVCAGSCVDGVVNGGESDVDCGGPCDRCDDGKQCYEGSDCTSGYCNDAGRCDVPPTCGGGCPVGEACVTNSACRSGLCDPERSVCVSTCGNGIRDGYETGVDCGGTACPTCGLREPCVRAEDCAEDLSCDLDEGVCLTEDCIELDVCGRLCVLCERDMTCRETGDCAEGLRCIADVLHPPDRFCEDEPPSCECDVLDLDRGCDGCRCLEGYSDCDGDGVCDSLESPRNCGACGNLCGSSEACVGSGASVTCE